MYTNVYITTPAHSLTATDMKLDNIQSDREIIQSRLLKHKTVEAMFTLGFFASAPKALSFTTKSYKGNITSIDMDSGYVEWTNEKGLRMPVVNINVIELLLENE